MALRPEVRGQHTLRSAAIAPDLAQMTQGNCSRCGFATQHYNACPECSSLSQAVGSGMQDPPLAAPQF